MKSTTFAEYLVQRVTEVPEDDALKQSLIEQPEEPQETEE